MNLQKWQLKHAAKRAEQHALQRKMATWQHIQTATGRYYMPYACDLDNVRDIAAIDILPRLRTALHDMIHGDISSSVVVDTKHIYACLYRAKLADIKLPYSLLQSIEKLCNLGILQIHIVNEILFSAEYTRNDMLRVGK